MICLSLVDAQLIGVELLELAGERAGVLIAGLHGAGHGGLELVAGGHSGGATGGDVQQGVHLGQHYLGNKEINLIVYISLSKELVQQIRRNWFGPLTVAGLDGGHIVGESRVGPAGAGGRTVASRVHRQVQALVHVGREAGHRGAAV